MDWISPIHSLLVTVLVAVAMSFSVIDMAQDCPWLGLTLAYDTNLDGAVVKGAKGPGARIPVGTVLKKVSAGGDELTLSALDFVTEPDGSIGTYQRYYEFLKRQDRMARMQASEKMMFQDTQGGEWTVRPQKERPLWNLSLEFWVQFTVGLMAWLLAASVWVLRPRETAARYLLLNGFGMLLAAQFAAVYTTRELAMPATLFWWIDGLNFLGGSLFGASLLALLLYYPRPLVARWVGWVVVGVYVIWYILQDQDVVTSMTEARRVLVMVGIFGTFVLAGVHWARTRKDPLARAALQWFLLSWIVATGIFSSMLFIPQLFGVDTSSLQGYGFLLFLLMYAGLGLGILRFRLFGLGEWWYRIVFWILAMLLLVVLDMVFLFGLRLSNRISLSVALLICGVFWFPLRAFLQSRLMAREKTGTATFKRMVDIALAPAGSAQQSRLYTGLLKDYFNPLNIQTVKTHLIEPEFQEHGQALVVPCVGGLPALRLEYAQQGQKLFSPKDVSAVKELMGMLQHAMDSQDSYKKGVVEERRRIAQDLHDDVGARLLDGLYSTEGNLRSTIQEAIMDIRSIVSGISGDQIKLSDFLADLRHEARTRCQDLGLELRWPLAEIPGEENFHLDYRVYKALGSSVREIISNAIKHSEARTLEIGVEISAGRLIFRISDDGKGIAEEALDGHVQGRGLKILQRRIADLKGIIDFQRREPGTGIFISVPIA